NLLRVLESFALELQQDFLAALTTPWHDLLQCRRSSLRRAVHEKDDRAKHPSQPIILICKPWHHHDSTCFICVICRIPRLRRFHQASNASTTFPPSTISIGLPPGAISSLSAVIPICL